MSHEQRAQRAAEILSTRFSVFEKIEGGGYKAETITPMRFSVNPSFSLKSGLRAPVYIDNRYLQSLVSERAEIAELLAEEVTDISSNIEALTPDAFAAVATGAITHTTLLAYYKGKPMVTVHGSPKEHGNRIGKIDGVVIPKQRYWVVDDHFSTGGSAIEAVETIQEAGGNVTFAMSISSSARPATISRFLQKEIVPISIVSIEQVLKKQISLGLVSPTIVPEFEEWQHDPENWARKRGFA